MNRKNPARRLLALALVTALTALSGTIPILDVMVGDGKAAVETHHIPGTHGFPHNHLLCIQHQASQWSPGHEVPSTLVLAWVHLPDFLGPTTPVSAGQRLLRKARAPPPA
jgi:hypothetical protein